MKIPGWEQRLSAYLREANGKLFSWGGHDCVLFSLGAFDIQAGTGHAASLAGTYKSAKGAARAMQRRFKAKTLGDAAEAFRAEHGVTECPVKLAQRGSIVLADVNTPDGISEALGVVDMDGKTALFAGPSGLVRLPLKDCKRAWGID